MNGWIPSDSARRAAWLLTGTAQPPLEVSSGPISSGEAERLELVDAVASRIKTADTAELAVCRRLLEHLCGRTVNPCVTSCLQ